MEARAQEAQQGLREGEGEDHQEVKEVRGDFVLPRLVEYKLTDREGKLLGGVGCGDLRGPLHPLLQPHEAHLPGERSVSPRD